MQKFGIAQNFWQKKYKVNDAKLWARPQLLVENIQSELSRSLGLPTTSDKEIENELCRSFESLQHLAKRIQSELSRSLDLPTTFGKKKET